MIDVIIQNKIAGAVLDVFENEPNVSIELINSSKVVVFPHITSRTNETFKDMEDLVIENLEKYFTTGEIVTPVEKG